MKDNTFHSIWFHAQRALRNVNAYQYRPADQTYSYGPRRWWLSLNESFDLHPVIRNIVEKHCVRPADWQLLLLEWPHVSIEDDSKIAYTRNEENGQDFLRNGSARQTKTTIGKYLSRHWPHVPDHIRRDWAGVFGVSQFDIWDTKEGIISSVELGPQSCMKSSYGSIPFLTSDNETLLQYHAGTANAAEVPWHRHPYFVYNPEYGWRAAVRYAAGKPTVVLGRCLVNVNNKVFVRSYMRNENEGGTSYTDERLEAWLREQGYERRGQWPHGVRFDCVEHPDGGGIMMPYIDGGERRVSEEDNHMVLDGDGPECDNTNGSYESRTVYGECEDCGATVYDDDEDRIWVGSSESRLVGGVCGCCNDYRHVQGDGDSYYVREDDAVRVRGDWYDKENLPDHIKELNDGEYEHEDFCTYVENQDTYFRTRDVVECETDGNYYEDGDDEIVEIDGHWYRKDDTEVVECADEEYRKKDECWQCEYSNEWYPDDEEGVDVEGGKYHPDSLREMADNA